MRINTRIPEAVPPTDAPITESVLEVSANGMVHTALIGTAFSKSG